MKTVIYSKRVDPMMGITTYRLTKITRGEPDIALFRVPSDYTVNEPNTRVINKIENLDQKKK